MSNKELLKKKTLDLIEKELLERIVGNTKQTVINLGFINNTLIVFIILSILDILASSLI